MEESPAAGLAAGAGRTVTDSMCPVYDIPWGGVRLMGIVSVVLLVILLVLMLAAWHGWWGFKK